MFRCGTEESVLLDYSGCWFGRIDSFFLIFKNQCYAATFYDTHLSR
nr:MAG TPA: hypothetical protein [Caudoviricetes sp.]